MELAVTAVLEPECPSKFKNQFRQVIDSIRVAGENAGGRFNVKTRTKFMLQDLITKYEELMKSKKAGGA